MIPPDPEDHKQSGRSILDKPIFNTALQVVGGLIAGLVVVALTGELQLPTLVIALLVIAAPIVLYLLYWRGGWPSVVWGTVLALMVSAGVLIFVLVRPGNPPPDSAPTTTSAGMPTATQTFTPVATSTLPPSAT